MTHNFRTGTTLKPIIVESPKQDYVLVGSVDHGMRIPEDSILKLINSLNGFSALMMETPKEFFPMFHPMSAEVLVKASVGRAPVHYLSGNRLDEDIGGLVPKYAPRDIAEVYAPCLHVRNRCQSGQKPTLDSIFEFTSVWKGRFGFIDAERAIKEYMQVLQYWKEQGLNPHDLDDFSYDFEKFVGDVREFELWQPELREFKRAYKGKVAVCVGYYHIPFVRDVFDGREVKAPNWASHIDTRREDKLAPQDADFLRNVYANLEKALSGV